MRAYAFNKGKLKIYNRIKKSSKMIYCKDIQQDNGNTTNDNPAVRFLLLKTLDIILTIIIICESFDSSFNSARKRSIKSAYIY